MEYDVQARISKPKTRSFKTEDDAKKYLASIMYQKENPLFIEHHGIPLVELMRTNLKLKLDTNQISATQFTRVTDTINKLAKIPVVNKNIDNISSEEIQEYLNSIKHLSNSSIKKEYEQFSQAFKVAINKGYIMRNPMNDVIKPKSEKENKEVRALTVEEQQAFTDYLIKQDINKCKYKNIYFIQMYMGLSFLYPYIVEQMQIADAQNNNEEKLLFKPNYSQYTRQRTVNDQLKAILKDNFGITDITTHSLRHTYGTRCIEAGMAPVVVQKLMGHKNISVTLNTYTSVFDKFKQNEVDKVNKYYMNENLFTNDFKHLNGIEEDKTR